MEPLHALGAMSGTSLDGVDAALVVTDGERIHDFGRSAYLAYTVQQRAVLRAALGQWQNGPDVAEAAEVVETVHARVLSRFPEAGLIGFHGQTFAHDPENRRTHQAGDGAMLAEVLGKPVIWDFRTMDVTLGGEGAPLAPAYHFACAQWMGATEPVGFLNLGGVGNLTWVNPVAPDMSDKGALLAFDTGPANAPIDDLAQRHFGHAFDKDGALADAGRVATGLVDDLLAHSYFLRKPPKSLDRDSFRQVGAKIDALPPEDAAATWVAVLVESVRLGLRHCPTCPKKLLVTGGGRKNPVIMRALQDLPTDVAPVEAFGLDGDMLEAQAFGFLAVRVWRGLPTSFPDTTGVRASIGGGQVSHPSAGPDVLRGSARHRRVVGLTNSR